MIRVPLGIKSFFRAQFPSKFQHSIKRTNILGDFRRNLSQASVGRKINPRKLLANAGYSDIKKRFISLKLSDPFSAEKINRATPLLRVVLVVCATSFVTLVFFFSSHHWFIEYFVEPTSLDLDEETRNLLHFYAYRKKMYPAPRVAEKYILKAIQNLKEHGKLDLSDPVVLDLVFKLADAKLTIRNYEEAEEVLKLFICKLTEVAKYHKMEIPENSPILLEPISYDVLTEHDPENPDNSKALEGNETISAYPPLTATTKEWMYYKLAESYFMLGQTNYSLENFDSAKQMFEESFNYSIMLVNKLSTPEFKKMHTEQDYNIKLSAVELILANSMISLGEIYTMKKDFPKAELMFKTAIRSINAHDINTRDRNLGSNDQNKSSEDEFAPPSDKKQNPFLSFPPNSKYYDMEDHPFQLDVTSSRERVIRDQPMIAKFNEIAIPYFYQYFQFKESLFSITSKYLDSVSIPGFEKKSSPETTVESSSSPKSQPEIKADAWTCLDAVAWNQLAQLYKVQDKTDDFINSAKKSINISYPKSEIYACAECSSFSLRLMGQMFEEQQKTSEAAEYYGKALVLAKQHSLPTTISIEQKLSKLWNQAPTQ
ncbi:hypothetical protein BB560_000485 [Smittium megazygosporum]|uniref:Uncharacterized protein n=1 Tax=Smittium megazygosporum TaxID=133381 RepID=A0A2T9ZKB8_9FUNG|nr:hypothetical protein BB560_000485 [Smittium megazygosporum]